MNHGGMSVMKCFSILLGLIFDNSKSGEYEDQRVLLH